MKGTLQTSCAKTRPGRILPFLRPPRRTGCPPPSSFFSFFPPPFPWPKAAHGDFCRFNDGCIPSLLSELAKRKASFSFPLNRSSPLFRTNNSSFHFANAHTRACQSPPSSPSSRRIQARPAHFLPLVVRRRTINERLMLSLLHDEALFLFPSLFFSFL